MSAPLTWPAPWARLAAAAGGVDALAALVSSSRRQLVRWALGATKPSGPAVAMLVTTARALGVRCPVGESTAEARTGVLFPLTHNKTLAKRMRAATVAENRRVRRRSRKNHR